ncbi:hypothetical protein PR048_021421 [Dryococelus australis]|uniref:Uncharacterized protein n=1 Tax=Dryococelus australis TaxID=614101 RepID=A0ABQ9GY55_9NEOP|nr:hypothetical protein PR048_021421 [Dryococelus australis]
MRSSLYARRDKGMHIGAPFRKQPYDQLAADTRESQLALLALGHAINLDLPGRGAPRPISPSCVRADKLIPRVESTGGETRDHEKKPVDQRHRPARFPYAGVTPPGIESGSSRWEVSSLITAPPRPAKDKADRFSSSVHVPNMDSPTTSKTVEFTSVSTERTSLLLSSCTLRAQQMKLRRRANYNLTAILPPVFELRTHAHTCGGRGGPVVRQLASHLGESGSTPGGVAPGFSHVGIVPIDASGQRAFSRISRLPGHCIPALLYPHLTSPSSALKTSLVPLLESDIYEAAVTSRRPRVVRLVPEGSSESRDRAVRRKKERPTSRMLSMRQRGVPHWNNKVDNMKKTGAAGGKNAKYNEIDNIVLDIIGKESSIIASLGIPETWSEEIKECANITSYEQGSTSQDDEQNNDASVLQLQFMTERNEKYQFQVEHLELLNEKIKVETNNLPLQTLKLEKELGLSPSKIAGVLCGVQNVIYEISEENTCINGNAIVDGNVSFVIQ